MHETGLLTLLIIMNHIMDETESPFVNYLPVSRYEHCQIICPFIVCVEDKTAYSNFKENMHRIVITLHISLLNHTFQILHNWTWNRNDSVSRYWSQNVWKSVHLYVWLMMYVLYAVSNWFEMFTLITICRYFRGDIAWPPLCLVTWLGCWWAWQMGKWLSSLRSVSRLKKRGGGG